jgi:ferritin-like metal-binding protein YciE
MSAAASLNAEQAKSAHELLVTGLKNAHALEKQSASVMEQQVARLDAFPEFKTRLEKHIQETHAQAERLERMLEKLGSSPSSLKDTAMSMMGSGQSATQMMADDNVLKAAIANLGVEAFEIASYLSLIRLAHLHGEPDLHAELERSLAEEREMYAWLEENLPGITEKFAMRA